MLLEELVQFTYELYPPVDQAVVSEEKPKEPVNLEVPESDVIVPEPVVFPADSWILVKAVSSSFERLTRLLLKLGASLETYGAVGMTSLDYAVRQRNPAILKLLIDNGIELGKNKTLSYHAIHSAVMYGLPEMVQQLVDAGLDLNLRNTTGLSASYLAAWYRYHKALKPLIAAGADIDDDSKGKWTPLTCKFAIIVFSGADILDRTGTVAMFSYMDINAKTQLTFRISCRLRSTRYSKMWRNSAQTKRQCRS